MKIIASAISALLLASCATEMPIANVVPKPNNLYDVQTSAATQDDAMQYALYSAAVTCRERNMRHVVTKQKTQYKGAVSENLNKSINRFAALASTTRRNVPTLSTDEDYVVSLEFTCQ